MCSIGLSQATLKEFANSYLIIPELLAFLEFLLLLIEYFHLTFFFVEGGQALNCYERGLDNFHLLYGSINEIDGY